MKSTLLVLTLLTAVLAAPDVSKPVLLNSTDAKPSPRVTGGNEATPHSFPYQAFLLVRSGGSSWYCQGALISENYVLTTALCVEGADQVEVTLGAHRVFEQEDTQITVTSTKVTVHEEYIDEVTNNIAVVRLPVSVRFTPAIRAIPLPSQDDVGDTYAGALTTMTGWGATVPDGSWSDVLNFLQARVISNAECARIWTIYSSLICTSGAGYVGMCYDHGAPLVTDGVLIGVNSFAATACSDGYPSVFTRITSFLPWILDHTDA